MIFEFSKQRNSRRGGVEGWRGQGGGRGRSGKNGGCTKTVTVSDSKSSVTRCFGAAVFVVLLPFS